METSATVGTHPPSGSDNGAVVALLNDLRWDDRQGPGAATGRDRGVGLALMAEAVARAEAAGCYKIQLVSRKVLPGCWIRTGGARIPPVPRQPSAVAEKADVAARGWWCSGRRPERPPSSPAQQLLPPLGQRGPAVRPRQNNPATNAAGRCNMLRHRQIHAHFPWRPPRKTARDPAAPLARPGQPPGGRVLPRQRRPLLRTPPAGLDLR